MRACAGCFAGQAIAFMPEHDRNRAIQKIGCDVLEERRVVRSRRGPVPS